MRLITKESKSQSRTTTVKRSSGKRGLVVTSAEGVRFAHTAIPLPSRSEAGKKE